MKRAVRTILRGALIGAITGYFGGIFIYDGYSPADPFHTFAVIGAFSATAGAMLGLIVGAFWALAQWAWSDTK